jgi:hypothetical protein
MHKSGCLVLVKTTLSMMPIYTAISISLPPMQKAPVKIFKAFLWSGSDVVQEVSVRGLVQGDASVGPRWVRHS